ncbi:MAG: GAF domain-containing protein [Planctomycetota bacterium]|nr:GAF domain-containing protein [Planctomycetota bacterium]
MTTPATNAPAPAGASGDAAPSHATLARDYAAILRRHALDPAAPPAPVSAHAPEFADRLRRFLDIAWGALWSSGISWIGFYVHGPHAGEMSLVAREPKPACSPIGLHGLCGRGWRDARCFVVPDVRSLGPNYVACDPRDQSELVVPVVLADGTIWGVLDADSFDLGAFTPDDARGLTDLLVAIGISYPVDDHRRVEVL